MKFENGEARGKKVVGKVNPDGASDKTNNPQVEESGVILAESLQFVRILFVRPLDFVVYIFCRH